ncbi:hypothetical protein DPMN_078339 [Dreissena polymorpha]|uniref:Uncharacterized protein n=1 Tax=Dreissena polymorpha TaxID=45954 RepID=A0A9D4BS27_DREPO|nr:hypothetical protein DPMN_078339 [Dreissena polymorpha]
MGINADAGDKESILQQVAEGVVSKLWRLRRKNLLLSVTSGADELDEAAHERVFGIDSDVRLLLLEEVMIVAAILEVFLYVEVEVTVERSSSSRKVVVVVIVVVVVVVVIEEVLVVKSKKRHY